MLNEKDWKTSPHQNRWYISTSLPDLPRETDHPGTWLSAVICDLSVEHFFIIPMVVRDHA